MDRAGLNITTFLATTVLQTEAKVSKLPTWLDFFFNVCMGYQTVTFLVTVVGARRFGIHSARHSAAATPSASSTGSFPGMHKLAKRGSIRRNSVAGFFKLESSTDTTEPLAPPLTREPMQKRMLQFIAQEAIGDAADDFQDLFGTRILIPSFMCVMMIISLQPNFNRSHPHPDAGISSPLFITNFLLFCLWLAAFFTVLGDRLYTWFVNTTRKAKRLTTRRRSPRSCQANTLPTEDLPASVEPAEEQHVPTTPMCPMEDCSAPYVAPPRVHSLEFVDEPMLASTQTTVAPAQMSLATTAHDDAYSGELLYSPDSSPSMGKHRSPSRSPSRAITTTGAPLHICISTPPAQCFAPPAQCSTPPAQCSTPAQSSLPHQQRSRVANRRSRARSPGRIVTRRDGAPPSFTQQAD